MEVPQQFITASRKRLSRFVAAQQIKTPTSPFTLLNFKTGHTLVPIVFALRLLIQQEKMSRLLCLCTCYRICTRISSSPFFDMPKNTIDVQDITMPRLDSCCTVMIKKQSSALCGKHPLRHWTHTDLCLMDWGIAIS